MTTAGDHPQQHVGMATWDDFEIKPTPQIPGRSPEDLNASKIMSSPRAPCWDT
jgi:hypothetical protein